MANPTKYEKAIAHAADAHAAFRIALKRFKDHEGYDYTKEILERDLDKAAAFSEGQIELIADVFGKSLEQVGEDVQRAVEAGRLMYF